MAKVIKLKMRKVKSFLRNAKKKLSEKYDTKITECIFPKYQLKFISDFLYSEKQRKKIKQDYSCNIVKIGSVAIGSFKNRR